MSSNATASSTANQDLPKVVITLGVLAGALIIGLVIAKVADYLYERSSVRDDASDISEHTKEILKTQLELMRMGKTKDKKDDKKDDPEAEKEKATKAMNVWSSKVKAKAKLNPIPESGETGEATCAVDDGNKSKGKGSVALHSPTPSKKDDPKKYQDAVKAWNEVEKGSKGASNNTSPAKTKGDKTSAAGKSQSTAPKADTSKGGAKSTPTKTEKSAKATGAESSSKTSSDTSPSKSGAKDDAEFEVPAAIAAPTTSSKSTTDKKNPKSSAAIVPANLNKNVEIRPQTAGKVDENMPGYMRPKTPFSQRNFSRYNGTVDPTRSTDKTNAGGSSKS